MLTYKPYAVVLMLSGGDDSLLAERVIKELGIEIDAVIHGVTGTGIKESRKFVHQVCANSKFKLYEANAGTAYERYVLKKGFFGLGTRAHAIAYHLLKSDHFTRTVHQNIRMRIPNRYVLFLSGVRVDESDNRADNFADKYINPQKNGSKNIWVNLVHWWTTKERDAYLAGNSVPRNPVSIALGRSGECMCGTMQNMATGLQAALLFPEWGQWWHSIRKETVKKFPWDWGQNISRGFLLEKHGQINLFNEPMPMCVGCKSQFKNTTPCP